jgi:GNAT superfamily N-acetyltransferase
MDVRIHILDAHDATAHAARPAGVTHLKPPADAYVIAETAAGPQAGGAVWLHPAARYRDQSAAYVGGIRASDRAMLAHVLHACIDLVRTHDVACLIGPLDGNTWHAYRTVTDATDVPPFPHEPFTPPWWNDAFGDAGFDVVERYWSGIAALTESMMNDLIALPESVEVRPLDASHCERELEGIYDLAVSAFTANPLYEPIERLQFVAMYKPILERVDPRFCLIVQRPGRVEPVGFVLALPCDTNPDVASESRGTVVLKTAAVARELRSCGLGTALLHEVMRRAGRAGFGHAIFALMHDANPSARIAQRIATPFRRYALYGRRVQP